MEKVLTEETDRVIMTMIYESKPLRQKKGRGGLYERADYGVSSAKALCVIWAVEGSVKCTDVRLALEVGSMLVL